MASSIKLYYFDFRGLGELVRLLLNLSDVKYEDVRLQREAWETEYKQEMPLGKIPVLEVDGKKIPQSGAIARYLARKHDLYGKDNAEMTQVDVIYETMCECRVKVLKWIGEKDVTIKENIKKNLIEKDIPEYLEFVKRFLKENKSESGYFVGDSLTLADLAIFDNLENLERFFDGCLKECPTLLKHRELVKKHEKLKNYIENRK